MKIVRENINEIKRGESGFGSIGVGRNEVLRKLREFYQKHVNYSHALQHDIHGERIAKMLNMPMEDIMQCGVELDLLEVILYFEPHASFGTKYGNDYWIWK